MLLTGMQSSARQRRRQRVRDTGRRRSECHGQRGFRLPGNGNGNSQPGTDRVVPATGGHGPVSGQGIRPQPRGAGEADLAGRQQSLTLFMLEFSVGLAQIEGPTTAIRASRKSVVRPRLRFAFSGVGSVRVDGVVNC